MAAHLTGQVKVIAPAWILDYATNVHEIVAKHGGKHLSRSGNIETYARDRLDATIITSVEFPDRASLDPFANSPEYAPFAEARTAGSESHLRVIDDAGIAGGIPYRPAGKSVRHVRQLVRQAGAKI
ncbi:DUF1330 domain-containing protein [Nereida ignava]|uniref:DUF1330 domain-containing protein n=1 Tax=Nereida ignava TaxID=282199 RepID=UPI002FE01819